MEVMMFLLVTSLLITTSSANYTDDFARNVMFPLSAAAYSNHPWICLATHFPYSKLYRQIFVDCDSFEGDICSGFTAVMPRYKAIAMSFRFLLFVTGHSLGGAMASLAASYLVATGLAERSKVKLVTSGQPRTGDKLFALNHDSQLDFSYRVTHWHDIVPHIPVFYQQGMPPANFTICSGGEDNNCSNGVWHTSISDHRQYFSQLVSQYGARGCY
ncbi:unnamed protein product [Heligmosomoides polygyrus]|uniref:Lipase_3 domain-containing protein n=1 Tax=Heligmosomoides polygyrus TaxID=6339 RepID=A0A3P8D1G5_HELPZ|nr:unnamed protein product [Heligmosomoides polygyrus]